MATTKTELRARADELGIDHKEAKTKADLEALLAAAMAEDEEGDGEVTMSGTLRSYKPKYREQAVGEKGRMNNGDAVAAFLLSHDPFQTAELATRVLQTTQPLYVGDGSGKYDHLNPGQIRMNSGNMIRAAIKRGDITPQELGIKEA